jgi:hypothetical protein
MSDVFSQGDRLLIQINIKFRMYVPIYLIGGSQTLTYDACVMLEVPRWRKVLIFFLLTMLTSAVYKQHHYNMVDYQYG